MEADADGLEKNYKEYSAQAVTKKNWSKRLDIETDFVHLIQRIIHWKKEAWTMAQSDTSVEPDEMKKRIKGLGEAFRETLTTVKFIAVDNRPRGLAGEKEEDRRQLT